VTTDNTHKRETSMPPTGFKPTIPASERPQTHMLDRAATGIGSVKNMLIRNIPIQMSGCTGGLLIRHCCEIAGYCHSNIIIATFKVSHKSFIQFWSLIFKYKIIEGSAKIWKTLVLLIVIKGTSLN
jgi:hypothetical protein